MTDVPEALLKVMPPSVDAWFIGEANESLIMGFKLTFVKFNPLLTPLTVTVLNVKDEGGIGSAVLLLFEHEDRPAYKTITMYIFKILMPVL